MNEFIETHAGLEPPQDISASEEAGCNGHLSKPFSKDKLFSAIKEYGHSCGVIEKGSSKNLDDAAL